MSAVQEWTSTSIEQSVENNDDFLHQLQVSMALDIGIINVLHLLLNERSREENWTMVVDHYQWESMDHGFLLSVIVMIHNHKHGHILVNAILSLNKFHFEHFEEILIHIDSINFYTIGKIIRKILDIGVYFDDTEKGRNLAKSFAKKVNGFLDKHASLDAWQKMADDYAWDQIDVWLLRATARSQRVCSHEHGYVLLQKIIPLNILRPQDVGTIAKKLNHSQTRWVAKSTLWDTLRKQYSIDHSRYLIQTMFPAVDDRRNIIMLSSSNDHSEIMGSEKYATWRRLMSGNY